MAESGSTFRRVRTVAGWIIGVVLIGAAVVIALRGAHWSELQHAQPWQVGVMLALMVINVGTTAALNWVVTLSFDAEPPVPLRKYLVLTGASGLLNYLFSAGTFGRAAYLKTRHNLPIKQFAIIFILLRILGSVIILATLAVAMLSSVNGWNWIAGAAVVAVLTPLMPGVAWLFLRRRLVAWWSWMPLQVVDTMCGAMRLWLACQVIGHPLPLSAVLLAETVGRWITLTGITPGGLGLSEWAIASVSKLTQPGAFQTTLRAALVDRTAEIIVSVVTGLISVRVLGKEGGFGESVKEENAAPESASG